MSARHHDEAARAALLDLPAATIESLRHAADVKVVGTMRRLGDLLISPVSKRACIAWDLWRPDHSHASSAGDFVLADATAELRVEAGEAALVMLRTRYQVDEERGLSMVEGVLRPDDVVAVRGRIRFEVTLGEERGYREMAGRRPVLVASHIARDGSVF